jgi:hypothetical protein
LGWRVEYAWADRHPFCRRKCRQSRNGQSEFNGGPASAPTQFVADLFGTADYQQPFFYLLATLVAAIELIRLAIRVAVMPDYIEQIATQHTRGKIVLKIGPESGRSPN